MSPTRPSLAQLVNMVRPNTLRYEQDTSRWYKRRHSWAIPIIGAGNFVMWAAGQPIITAITPSGWHQWERAGYDALHSGLAQALPDAQGGLWMTAMPGHTLKDTRELDAPLLRAVGAELSRAHRCRVEGRAFRHGDPHLGNFTYCQDTQRAYLIDFETRYLKRLDEDQAQIEDLFVLLLDLAGRATTDAQAQHWSGLALEGYGDGAPRQALHARQLRRAWWLERVFLSSRAHELPWRILRPRLEAIAASLLSAPA